MSNTTINIQSVVNLCRTQVELLPIADVGGFTNEPALSLANDTLQELLASPADWGFNRVEMPIFVTSPRRQDYNFAGATAFTINAGAGIDLVSNNAITESSNTVTVKTLEPHRFVVGDTVYMTGNTIAAYNSTFTDDGNSSTWSGGWTILTVPTTTSFTFTHASSGLAASGAPGITDFGWLTGGTMVLMNNNASPQYSRYLEAAGKMQPSSLVATPTEVGVLNDPGTGILKIRFKEVPGSVTWGTKLVYQAKAPLKVSLTDTWAPFPDQYSFVYRQMFLARCYRYLNSPRSEVELQKAQQAIAKALGADDRETDDIHVYPQSSLMGSEPSGFGF